MAQIQSWPLTPPSVNVKLYLQQSLFSARNRESYPSTFITMNIDWDSYFIAEASWNKSKQVKDNSVR
jgi:hypothetical protein